MPRKASAAKRMPQTRVPSKTVSRANGIAIPANLNEVDLKVSGGTVHLTNLNKIFWPDLGLTKRDLLQYYAGVSTWLLPHLKDRAMVMKRYPNGISGEFFFMKRTPSPRPPFLSTCSIEHASGNIIDFPMIQHLASLLWVRQSGLHRFESMVRAMR